MPHFKDLSLYVYSDLPDSQKNITLNVGWLCSSEAYSRGDVPNLFLDKLWAFSKYLFFIKRGFHKCNLCHKSNEVLVVKKNNEKHMLGFAELRVFGGGDKIFSAPNLIYHYVTEHSYRPPDEFVDAVLNGPEPESDAYLQRLKKYRLKYMRMEECW